MRLHCLLTVGPSRCPTCQQDSFWAIDTGHLEANYFTVTTARVLCTHSVAILVQAGLVSGWLHDNLDLGKQILFRGVDGDFTLDRAAKCIPAQGKHH